MRNAFFLAIAVVACPCHLPLTLPIVGVLVGGTALGGAVGAWQGLFAGLTVTLFIGSIIGFLFFGGASRLSPGASCKVSFDTPPKVPIHAEANVDRQKLIISSDSGETSLETSP